MADGAFPGLVSKDRNVNAATNPIYTQLSDGTATIGVTGGALDVNIDNASIVVTATDLDIRALDHVTIGDSVRIGDGTDLLAINTNGSIDVETPFNVDSVAGATDAVFPAGAIRDDALTTLTPADGDYVNLRTDNQGALWVNIGAVVDLDIRDLSAAQDNVAISDGTDTLAVNTDGSINVNIVSAAITGEIHDYDTASAVASDGTSNHDYTVANTTFLLRSVIVSGSGNVKFEIQTGPLASLATVAVGFLTGRQGDTQQVFFDPPVEVPVTSTGTVRVIRTNRQGAAMDVYSTIIGVDV